MPTHPVQAAAEGMSAISRRTFLRSTAGAATLGGMAIMATPLIAAAVDPCLVFVTDWSTAVDGCNAAPAGEGEAFYNTHCQPFESAAAKGKVPSATTAEGAAAALRKALDFGDMENQDEALVRAALAFLEGRS